MNGADNGTRTRGLDLGKVALYQLSYVRKQMKIIALFLLLRKFNVKIFQTFLISASYKRFYVKLVVVFLSIIYEYNNYYHYYKLFYKIF